MDSQTYNIFFNAFPEVNYYEHEYGRDKYGIDILEMTPEYLFASCSISNNIAPTSFMQIRDMKTKQREPFHIENLEKYTYLFIDFKANRMVVMAGRGLSKITEVIVDYIDTKTNGLSDIAIFAEIIQDFDKNAKRFSKIRDIEFKVAETSPGYVPGVQTSLEGLPIESFIINVRIKEKTDGLLDQLKHLKNSNSKIQSLKAYGKNEYNLDDVIDFFSTQFTKTIPVDIDEKTALDQEYIRNKLLDALK